MGRIRAWRPVLRLLSESETGREEPAIAQGGSLASRSALIQANTLAVEIRNAAAKRGNRLIWSGVSAEIRRGEFLAVLGPNGVGKSTLVKVILGLLPLASGEVRVLGQPPSRSSAIHRFSFWTSLLIALTCQIKPRRRLSSTASARSVA